MRKPGSFIRRYFQVNRLVFCVCCAIFAALLFAGCSNAPQSSSATPTPELTLTSTLTGSPSSTATPTVSLSPTPTPTVTPTLTPSPTPIPTPRPTPTPTATPTSPPGSVTDMVTKYYQALEQRNYTLAYSFLDPNATTTSGQKLTLSVFTNLAMSADANEGTIQTFSIGAYPPLIVMTITRRYGPYHAHLQVKLEGNSWKITSLDRI